jgi:SAM-dependent methyltransferase
MSNPVTRHDPWEKAILLERKFPPQPSLLKTISYLQNKNNALILGDACQINSRYLIEKIGFEHIDNIDGSPVILDQFYDSPKMSVYNLFFPQFHYPENTYDFVYGKSLTFIKPEYIEDILKKIAASLKIGGIFSSVWNLPQSTRKSVFSGIWEKNDIERYLQETGLIITSSEEIIEESKSLSGELGLEHRLEIIMRKD